MTAKTAQKDGSEAQMQTAIRTLPAQWYCDPEIYKRERENIFASSWIYAAHTEEIPNPGDYVTVEIAGYGVYLIRDRDGEIRAFHNVCRHRASPLLTCSSGNVAAKTITCRYHGWSYNLEGKLVAAPLYDDLPDCQKDELSLYDIQVAVHRGLIFINMSNQAEPFEQTFERLTGIMNTSDCPLEAYSYHSKVTREGNFNWKVWVDGFQECYHCMTIHPIFTRDFALQKYKVENDDRFSVHSCERKTDSPTGNFNGLWLWVFPNLGLPCYEPCFYTLRVNPLAVNKTRLEYTFHFRDLKDEKTIREFHELIEQITNEDISICESVQKNLEAGIYKEGILNPARENGVAYFQNLVRQAVCQ